MTSLRSLLVAGAAALTTAACAQTTFIDDFENNTNFGRWTYATIDPTESIEPTGGNPGAYLRNTLVDTFAPRPFSLNSTGPFAGDFRAKGVYAIGVDLIIHDVPFTTLGRPLSLVLVTDNLTPGNVDDDWAVFYIGGSNIPGEGEGWKSFRFNVPSQHTGSLPAGWGYIPFGPDSPAAADWDFVIQNVSRTLFWYHNPELFAIFQVWDTGLDNASVSTAPSTVRLSGVINANGLDDNTAGGIRLELRNPGNLNVVETFNLRPGPYSIEAPAGNYNVSFVGDHFLRKSQVVNLTSNTVLDVALINGDTDGNNAIDDADLTNLILDFGDLPTGDNGFTDVTGDFEVDDADLTVLILGFGQVGDN